MTQFTWRRLKFAVLAVFPLIVLASGRSYASETDACGTAPCESCAECAKPPAPPPPDFGGCCWCRPKLTGNWGGERICLAESGITFDVDETLFYQGVVSGGIQQRSAFGGHGDYLMNVDFGKLCEHEGAFLKLRAEHRYGGSVNRDTGAFLPVALDLALPSGQSDDVMLTDVLFTQALSEKFALFAGKMDTLDGDANAFASGRGKTQFSNAALVFNPIAALSTPYSTFGAGFVVLEKMQPIFSFIVMNPNNTPETGFENIYQDGVSLNAELRLPTTFFDLPGHQLIGGGWNSKTFTALDQDPLIILPGGGVPIATREGTWQVHYNFDQYLYVDPCNPTHGWGVFGRYGISDGNPNPLQWLISFGVGGSSPFCGREADTFGVGWYYAKASDKLGPIATQLLNLGDGQGVELFYNYEVTPWFHLTPDLQVIRGGLLNVDTALVLGLRGKLDF